MKKTKKIITIFLLFCLVFNITGFNFIRAQGIEGIKLAAASNQDKQFEKIGLIGGLILLGSFVLSEVLSQKEKTRKFNEYLAEGKKAMEESNYDKAVNAFNNAKEIKETNNVINLLAKANQSYRKLHYQKGIKYIKQKNWLLALEEFNKVKKSKKNYRAVNEYIEKATRKYQNVNYQQALQDLNDKNYKAAYKKLKQINKFGNYKNSIELEKETYQVIHYKKGNIYLKQNRLEQAYKEFRKVNKYGNYKNNKKMLNIVYQNIKAERTTRISINEFKSAAKSYGLEKLLSELTIHKLLSQNIKTIKIVESEQLKNILKAQNIKAESLLESDNHNIKLKLPGIDILITGIITSIDVDYEKYKKVINEGNSKRKYYIYKQIKAVETNIIYKLIDAKNGEVLKSVTITKNAEWNYSSKEGYTSNVFPSSNLIKKSIFKIANELVQRITQRFEKRLPPAPDKL